MEQLLFECTNCGWSGTGNQIKQMCPNCCELSIHTTVNPNAPAIDDSRDAFDIQVSDQHAATES